MLVCWLGRVVILSFLCHAQMNKVDFFKRKQQRQIQDKSYQLRWEISTVFTEWNSPFLSLIVFDWVGDNRLGTKMICTNFIDFYGKIIAFNTNCRESYQYVNRNISLNNISEISTLLLSCKIMSSNWVLMSTCGQERLHILKVLKKDWKVVSSDLRPEEKARPERS